MKIANKTKGTMVALNVEVADTFLSRMIGLIPRSHLNDGDGLVITKCGSIHMFFMRFSIDVIFADKEDTIVGLSQKIKPFHLSRIYFKSSYAIELPVGTILTSKSSLGDQLEWQKV